MSEVPHLTVVRGNPTDAELAAVVTVLTARGAAAAAAAALAARQTGTGPGRSAWASRDQLMRRPLHPGPDAWRASARQ